ncbi:MAG TPA: hypothetical protein VGO69_01935 [Pyrinomonadaceae bacterium]|jgi:hypothetical protein|nr:hypothetical protein [Pyrinomonadaceae bacterium]
MNLRRYAWFLLVAVLTFVIGVAAAFLVGQVNPFPHRHEGRKNCVRLSALPERRSSMMVYTVYRTDGTVVKAYEVDKTYGLDRLGATTDEAAPPPPPAMTDAPHWSR